MRVLTIKSIIIACTLLLGYVVMSPALMGGFYYDDQLSLYQLGLGGGIKSFSDWLHYVFSGTAGPLGRPISFASFTINAQNWPASAYYFKLTNVLIHLFNSLLVYFFIYSLLLKSSLKLPENDIFTISIVTMALWLLHPLQLSTILPIVQRMTELSASFTLLGLIYYLSFRNLLFKTSNFKIIGFSIIIILFGILAALSKENGILLPVYILCIEYVIFFHTNTSGKSMKYFKLWKIIMLYVPVAIVLVYLISQFFFPAPVVRDFTVWQRLISEPQVLLIYLNLLLIPQVHVSGIFNDTQPFYSSLLAQGAILSSVAIISLLLIGFFFRKKLVVLSFAILWFFSGHILESTTILLELYFEHRNYLPILGFLFAFSYYVNNFNSKFIKYFISISSIILFSFINYQNSLLWSSPLKHSMAALQESPLSVRANQAAAEALIERNQVEPARKHYQLLAEIYPQEASYQFQVLDTDCLLKKDNFEKYNQLSQKLRNTIHFNYSAMIANNIHLKIKKNVCAFIKHEQLMHLLNILEEKISSKNYLYNSNLTTELENIYLVKGNIFLDKNATEFAIVYFNKALQLRTSYDVSLSLANLYIITGQLNKAKTTVHKALKHSSSEKGMSSRAPQIKKLHKLLDSINNKKNTNDKKSN